MPACPTAKQSFASGQLTPESLELTTPLVDHVTPASADVAMEPSLPTATHVAPAQLADSHWLDPPYCRTTDQVCPPSELLRIAWASPTAMQTDDVVQLTLQRVSVEPDERVVQLCPPSLVVRIVL
jgi:hypothetical protein